MALDTATVDLLRVINAALADALPPDTPSDIFDSAVKAVMGVLGKHGIPWDDAIVSNSKGANVRSRPGTTPDTIVIATIAATVQVQVGQAEKGWRPVLVRGWTADSNVELR